MENPGQAGTNSNAELVASFDIATLVLSNPSLTKIILEDVRERRPELKGSQLVDQVIYTVCLAAPINLVTMNDGLLKGIDLLNKSKSKLSNEFNSN